MNLLGRLVMIEYVFGKKSNPQAVECLVECLNGIDLKGNNLATINADIEALEREIAAMAFLSNLGQQSHGDKNSTLIFEYDLHDLPKR